MKKKPRITYPDTSTGNVHVIAPAGVYFLPDILRTLRLQRSAVRREVRLGRLKIARRGGRYVCLGQWLIEWIETGVVQPQPPDSRRDELGIAERNGKH